MELLKSLYEIASPSGGEKKMRTFIKKQLDIIGASYCEDLSGNIYAIKGKDKTYPCIVAHMDEVHRRRKGFKIIQTDEVILGFNMRDMSQEGIGADDKNGIWVALKAMQKYDCIKCAFFVEEEVGCIGSYRADMSFFEDCRYVLQCDRKGSSDFISYASNTELCSSEFLKAINLKKFGYSKGHGMMTDVMALKENGLNVCCANISCGYYNPHTPMETTRIKDLLNCFNLVCWIIENCKDVYQHTGEFLEGNESMQIVIEELISEMTYGGTFEEEDFEEFYEYYKDFYRIDRDELHDVFMELKSDML